MHWLASNAGPAKRDTAAEASAAVAAATAAASTSEITAASIAIITVSEKHYQHTIGAEPK